MHDVKCTFKPANTEINVDYCVTNVCCRLIILSACHTYLVHSFLFLYFFYLTPHFSHSPFLNILHLN